MDFAKDLATSRTAALRQVEHFDFRMIRRIAYFAAAPFLSLLAFHRIFRTWFQNDDFGWLTLRQWLPETGLIWTLVHPVAQGTVRVLSERIPFLVIPSIFGLDPLPFRILAFTTWIAALTLALLIGRRLTGSMVVGLIAAILWGVHPAMTRPLAWASDYNEILCALCLLAAFYARLRGKRAAEWIAYLIGFGVLEVIVVYPAIATFHALLLDRKRLRSAILLLIPAAVYSAIHVLAIPKSGGVEYAIVFDRRLLLTFWQYCKWAVAATEIYQFTGEYLLVGRVAAALIGCAVAIFLVWRTIARDFLPLFCCGWFVIALAPMLVLPNHVMDYVLATALPGLMWLGGYAVVWWRTAFGTIAVIYFTLLVYNTALYTEWFRVKAERIRAVFEGVQMAHRVHPRDVFLLQGIDNDVFQSGFKDEPFQIIGAKVFLVPGAERDVIVSNDTLDLKKWTISPRDAFAMLDRGEARVLGMAGNSMRDVTPIYKMLTPRGDIVDVADPKSAGLLGPGWYAAEDRLRWIGKSATLRMWGPSDVSQKLYVTGFAPKAAVPVSLRFSVGAVEIGSATISAGDRPFSLEFALPGALVGQSEIELRIEASRTFRAPGDQRELGMAFGTFRIGGN